GEIRLPGRARFARHLPRHPFPLLGGAREADAARRREDRRRAPSSRGVLMRTGSEDPRADIALINRMVARAASAIGDLYDRRSRLLYGLILRIVRDRSEAEE